MFRMQRTTPSVVQILSRSRSLQNRLSQSVPRLQREHLLSAMAQALQVGLAAGTSSEASLRAMGNKLLVSARTCWFGAASDADLLLAAMQPNPTLDSDELPRSIAWHRAVYSVTAAKAVMLLVPPALLTLASRQDGRTRWDSMPLPFLREAAGGVMFLREPGIEAVTDAVNTNHVTVALGIGALTWGMDGYEVVARLHSAERAAEIALRAE